MDNLTLHKTCLKCEHCKVTLKLGNYAGLEGKYYVSLTFTHHQCKPHFKQLFKLKGNYFEAFGQEDIKKKWEQE